MTLKIQRLFNIAMVLITWLTLPMFGLRNLKRFLPSTVLVILFEIVNALYGKKQKWWVFYNKPNSFLFGEAPYYLGPFLGISLWSLRWTYGSFKLYYTKWYYTYIVCLSYYIFV